MTTQQCRELTNKVFDASYWGYSKNSDEQVLVNRVAFYKKLRIGRPWTHNSIYNIKGKTLHDIPHEHDHVEAYKAGTGVVVLCSNYNYPPAPWMFMAECPPLYGFGARTYLRTYEGKEHAVAHLKAFDAFGWMFKAMDYESMADLVCPQNFGF